MHPTSTTRAACVVSMLAGSCDQTPTFQNRSDKRVTHIPKETAYKNVPSDIKEVPATFVCCAIVSRAVQHFQSRANQLKQKRVTCVDASA